MRYANAAGTERVVSIVGTDEVDLNRNHISWMSPLGRALMKSAAGDRVALLALGGQNIWIVLEVCYERISVEPFREPPEPRPRQRNSLAAPVHMTKVSQAAQDKSGSSEKLVS